MTDLTGLTIVTLLVWGGIFAYLLRLDRKVRTLGER